MDSRVAEQLLGPRIRANERELNQRTEESLGFEFFVSFLCFSAFFVANKVVGRDGHKKRKSRKKNKNLFRSYSRRFACISGPPQSVWALKDLQFSPWPTEGRERANSFCPRIHANERE